MKFQCSPSLFRQPFGTFTTTYGISEAEVFVVRSLLGIRFGDRPKMKVENVTRVYARGTVFGDVVFGEGSHEPVIWRNVYRPESKRRSAEAALEDLAEEKRQEERKKERYPAGARFSRRVVQLPPVSDVFDRALWIKTTSVQRSGFPHMFVHNGDWIKKGEPICCFDFHTSSKLTSKSTVRTCVYAPVSGVFLSTGAPFFSKLSWGYIFPPVGENPPETTTPMIKDFVELCWEHRVPLFQEPPELQGRPFYADESLRRHFDQLLCEKLDVVAVDTKIQEKIEFLMLHFPELSPYFEEK